MTGAQAKELGYRCARKLPTGEWAGIQPMLCTVALCVGINRDGYRTRFCFPDLTSAVMSLIEWDGRGFPPGYWIKQKPEGTPNPKQYYDDR